MSQPVGQELGDSSGGCLWLSISPEIVVRVWAHLRLARGRTCLQVARGHLAGLCSLLALGCYHRKCGSEVQNGSRSWRRREGVDSNGAPPFWCCSSYWGDFAREGREEIPLKLQSKNLHCSSMWQYPSVLWLHLPARCRINWMSDTGDLWWLLAAVLLEVPL